MLYLIRLSLKSCQISASSATAARPYISDLRLIGDKIGVCAFSEARIGGVCSTDTAIYYSLNVITPSRYIVLQDGSRRE